MLYIKEFYNDMALNKEKLYFMEPLYMHICSTLLKLESIKKHIYVQIANSAK